MYACIHIRVHKYTQRARVYMCTYASICTLVYTYTMMSTLARRCMHITAAQGFTTSIQGSFVKDRLLLPWKNSIRNKLQHAATR